MKGRVFGNWVLILLLFPVISAQAAGEYRTVEVEALKITIDSEWASQAAPGYLPVRFEITNLGDDRVIEIVGRGSRWFRTSAMGAGTLDVRQSLRLKRGDKLRLTLTVPVFADNENIQFQIRENGRTLESFNYASLQSGGPPEAASALIVADPTTPYGTIATGWPRRASGGRFYPLATPPGPGTTVTPGAARGRPQLDFVLDPPRLPTNWLGYTSVRAVFIGPKEWEQLNEAQKEALLTWTACGGDLMFVDGDLKTLFPGRQDLGAAAFYFFGHIYFPQSTAITETGLDSALAVTRPVDLKLNSGWLLPANRANDWGRIAERGFRLPIPGVAGAPTRAYLALLIVFSVLIGPINYLVLWRKRQQVLLVLTVPLISALFIALLAGYAVAGEGFGVRGRSETFTVLDQTSKQAATRANVSLYAAGMAPSGGLRFPSDMAVIPIGTDGRGSRDRQSVDFTDSQRFTAGLIQARSPSNFEEIGFRPARERLSFTSDGDRVNVVNGLGATVTQLYYRSKGKVYTLNARLQLGEKGMLQTGTGKGPESLIDLTNLIPLYADKFHNVVNNQADGSYLAVLERSPFWEPGVPNVDERGSFHLVLGFVEGEP